VISVPDKTPYLLVYFLYLDTLKKSLPQLLVKEIILENFMSYEYARIPFQSGVNIICGPNGSGKSSILVATSVALGQSYTERSKKLSDLIRWGKDQARVTIVLDNTHKSGHSRPVQRINKDYIYLTRQLRKDGKYWFELENRAASKDDVKRLLSKFSVDPENMLIIMHQNMVEEFTVLSPQEKLKIVEAAVGFETYRDNVLKAQKKLSRILSQEESVGKLLESAEQTLNYWREQYDRYQQKKQLQIKRRFLERELAWAEVAKREQTAEEIQAQIQERQKTISQIENEIKTAGTQLSNLQTKLQEIKNEWQKLYENRLLLEREQAKTEYAISMTNETIQETNTWQETYQNNIKEWITKIEQFETMLHRNPEPIDLKTQLTEIRNAYAKLEDTWTQKFKTKNQNLKSTIEKSNEELGKLATQITDIKTRIEKLNFETESLNNTTVDQKINLALLHYKEESHKKGIEKLEKELQLAQANCNEFRKKAEEMGPQIVPMKTVAEILDEIRVTDGHIAALADVSEDIERMYESYSKLYLELKQKAQVVEENREKALEEVKTRMEAWRTVIKNLLEHVNIQYQGILALAQATGEVRLTDEQDIEIAGLEILVGFKGAKPLPLNAHTQSGGERSTATMTFLLALQQHVKSPFRAVDEYDVHMDPRNREMIANLLVSSVKGLDAQYLAITPSQLSFTGNDVHVITVQNIEGKSIVKEVA
jgi:chromosome segregation protein